MLRPCPVPGAPQWPERAAGSREAAPAPPASSPRGAEGAAQPRVPTPEVPTDLGTSRLGTPVFGAGAEGRRPESWPTQVPSTQAEAARRCPQGGRRRSAAPGASPLLGASRPRSSCAGPPVQGAPVSTRLRLPQFWACVPGHTLESELPADSVSAASRRGARPQNSRSARDPRRAQLGTARSSPAPPRLATPLTPAPFKAPPSSRHVMTCYVRMPFSSHLRKVKALACGHISTTQRSVSTDDVKFNTM
ncbi:PREDICTED: uncharacterized protein C17orf96-like [Elephantulus edwardii]|uniref:uncharacterized protein C17orf96-like n=1 Tax=Elephantulus edwardii TaxID=28737 RepID=UPI0003F072A3|nr:PREDICTED: uncharacterized protein C17orf96-like [Elephantulus edwardii]